MDKWKKGLIWAAGIALLIALRRAVGRIALLLLVASTLAYLLLFLFLGNWAFAKKHF